MYPHGIMFHYFHDEKKGGIKQTQGSISGQKLRQIIDMVMKTNNLLSAEDFYKRAISGKLGAQDVCLTFDDGLSSQYQIAWPVLKSYGITAFWFVYTSVHIKGNYEKLEVYRVFRNTFEDMESFYDSFYRELCDGVYDKARNEWKSEKAKHYKPEAAYYTETDRRFRYVRDFVLDGARYDEIMNSMMNKRDFIIERECRDLWINGEELNELRRCGNIIGLHSHTHPTVMSNLDRKEQLTEYETCKNILSKILPDVEINAASYPCDYYNDDTLEIMKRLGIKVGFLAHMENKGNRLLIARKDSAEF